jgi:hypothetical protein
MFCDGNNVMPDVGRSSPDPTKYHQISQALRLFLLHQPLHHCTVAGEFATSSFCNNGMEWALGFMIGLSLGLLISARAITAKRTNRAIGRTDSGTGARGQHRGSEQATAISNEGAKRRPIDVIV